MKDAENVDRFRSDDLENAEGEPPHHRPTNLATDAWRGLREALDPCEIGFDGIEETVPETRGLAVVEGGPIDEIPLGPRPERLLHERRETSSRI